jgi:DNA-binding NarL/FixJ family response regulator
MKTASTQSLSLRDDAATFTRREYDALQLLVECKSNKEIAAAMCVCEKTVEFHLANLYAKIGARTRTEAALWATRRGMAEDTRDFPS